MNRILGKLRARLLSGGFGANIALLASGTALGQAILILASPVLSRLYTPADFGVFAVYSLIFYILLSINSFRYEYAVPLPSDEREAVALVVLCQFLVLATTAVFGVGFILWGDTLSQLTSTPTLRDYLGFLVITLLISGLFQTLEYWATRKKAFVPLISARTGQTITQATTQVGMGFLRLGVVGFVIGQVVGQAVGLVVLWRRFKPFRLFAASGVARSEVMKTANVYRKFPLYTTWASLIDLIGLQLPPTLFAASFSAEIAGYLAFTTRILGLPAMLIGQAVSQSFYPLISEHKDDDVAMQRLFARLASALLIIGLPVFIFIMLHGEWLFIFCFGSAWGEAGRYAQILAPWYLLSFITSPISTLYLVKGKQRTVFVFGIFIVVMRVSAIMLSAPIGDAGLSVAAFSAINLVIYLAFDVWLFRLADINFMGWLIGNKHIVVTNLLILGGGLVMNAQNVWLSGIVTGLALALSALWFTRRAAKVVT